MPRGRKKKVIEPVLNEPAKEDQQVCCVWGNICSPRDCGDKHYLCCSFCDNIKCDVRCRDSCEECTYLVTPKFHSITLTKKYTKKYVAPPHENFIQKIEDRLSKTTTEEKQLERPKRGRKPAVKEEPKTEVKRGRGRPPKK